MKLRGRCIEHTSRRRGGKMPDCDCDCDCAGTGGEMCPEGVKLAGNAAETYRHWIWIRHTFGSAAPETSEAEAACSAAAKAMRAHVEAAR